jgi:hypothetical protein
MFSEEPLRPASEVPHPGQVSNPQFRYSRTASVDAAMKLLDVQYLFNVATQPGGQLFGEQWRSSAIINQDYVLAAMILCLDFAWSMKVENGLPSDCEGESEIEAMWPRNRRPQALRSSYEIWCKSSTVSALAAKAAETLRVMLKDLESDNVAEPVRLALVSNPAIISSMLLLDCISTPHEADHFSPRCNARPATTYI